MDERPIHLDPVWHFCHECGSDRTGLLNLDTGTWICARCNHVVDLNTPIDHWNGKP